VADLAAVLLAGTLHFASVRAESRGEGGGDEAGGEWHSGLDVLVDGGRAGYVAFALLLARAFRLASGFGGFQLLCEPVWFCGALAMGALVGLLGAGDDLVEGGGGMAVTASLVRTGQRVVLVDVVPRVWFGRRGPHVVYVVPWVWFRRRRRRQRRRRPCDVDAFRWARWQQLLIIEHVFLLAQRVFILVVILVFTLGVDSVCEKWSEVEIAPAKWHNLGGKTQGREFSATLCLCAG
jgi:hypothetical protein